MITFSILIVDDEKTIREGLRALLGAEGYDVETATNGEEGLALFKEHEYALVLSDIMMPKMTGLDMLKEIKQYNPDTSVVLFTGFSTIDNVVEAIKSGAAEYLQKPINNDELLAMVKRIYNRHELKINNDMLRQQMLRTKFVQIIGKSVGIKKVKKEIKQVSKSDIPVLITGETGTGKELVARSIHDQGPRRDQPFVAINCASIPSDLLESELFGHERGAFSGAVVRKYGLFEVANKGTILLDEIGEMSMELQPKILRAIESKQFRRLGAQKEISSDFRVISSTHRNLLTQVDKGRFREDLFYRLSPFIIDVPALRRRKSDIPILVDYFSVRKGRHDPKNEVENDFINALQNYNWPGNIRELQNTLERVFLIAGDKSPSLEHLPPEIQDITSQIGGSSDATERQTLEEVERDYIMKVYRELGGNKTHVAKALGISLRSLYNKLEKYEIQN
ncbi:MAG: sigma-54 dependent transcriptional regulator [Candidatus Marinimicrobia bacterium]|nr:sigma-54 dependent transcriptional regulator [Candidatus Neomarinimicrobiota bacterium]